jgi:hypothetical protein
VILFTFAALISFGSNTHAESSNGSGMGAGAWARRKAAAIVLQNAHGSSSAVLHSGPLPATQFWQCAAGKAFSVHRRVAHPEGANKKAENHSELDAGCDEVRSRDCERLWYFDG